jgi:hypothetical protein
MIPRFGVAVLVVACGMVAFLPDWASSQEPPQVNRDIRSYVLFAVGEVDFKGGNEGRGRGRITGGNVGANGVGLGPTQAAVEICNNGYAFMSDGTQMVGDSVRFTPLCDVYNAFFNTILGAGGGVARNFSGPFTPPVISRLPQFPDFDCEPGAPNVTVTANQTATVAPGVYNEVRFQNATRVRMEAGLYRVCRFDTGQNVVVTTEPGVIMQVQERWHLSPGVDFAGPGCTGIPRVFVRGTGIGHNDNSINFSNNTAVWGHFYAGSHRIALGRSNDLHGTIWAGQLQGLIVGRIGSDFQTNVDYCPPVGTSDLS